MGVGVRETHSMGAQQHYDDDNSLTMQLVNYLSLIKVGIVSLINDREQTLHMYDVKDPQKHMDIFYGSC